MRHLPTTVHGALDYVVAVITIALPLLLGFGNKPLWVLVILGTFALFYSLLTDYEWGLLAALPFRFHLLLDVVFAAAMLAAPTLFEFPVGARCPSYAIGVLGLVVAAISDKRPERIKRHRDARR